MVASAGGRRAPFFRYWLSAFLADFGDGVRLAAFPLLAAQLTRSPAAVAAVTAVQGLPWLLIGAGAGGALAAAAGIRAPMLAGAAPIVAAMVLLAWRQRGRPPYRNPATE